MDSTKIRNAINELITHESVYRDAGISKEVQPSYDYLLSSGEEIIPFVVPALTDCAAGREPGMFWYGAEALCDVIAKYDSPAAKEALLTILMTDSLIVEFGQVRAHAATQLARFNDPSLIPKLLAASETPHAPTLAIKMAIEELGREMPLTPQIIIKEGSYTFGEAAIEYFKKYEAAVSNWTSGERCAYFWFYGVKVENVKGKLAALPFYAASILANPVPEAAAWSKFENVAPSSEAANRLASKYPLSSGNVAAQYPANVAQRKKWYQFWK